MFVPLVFPSPHRSLGQTQALKAEAMEVRGQDHGHEDPSHGQDYVQGNAYPMAVNEADDPPNNPGDQNALNY